LSQVTRRTRLIAAAMPRCCTGVFGNLRERERRRSKARTPCEMVASIPARRTYRCLNVLLRCLCRATLRAVCCASGVTVRVRRWYLVLEWTQSLRREQGPQYVLENWILISSGWCLRLIADQLLLVFQMSDRLPVGVPHQAQTYRHQCGTESEPDIGYQSTRGVVATYEFLPPNHEGCASSRRAARLELLSQLESVLASRAVC